MRQVILIFLLMLTAGCATNRDMHQPPVPGYNLLYEAKVDKTRAYLDEPLVLSYDLWTRYDTRYEGLDTEPQLVDFWIARAEPPKTVKREVAEKNDLKFVRATVLKIVLFPLRAGQQEIYPGTLKVYYRTLPTFSKMFLSSLSSLKGSMEGPLMLESEPIALEVMDFPSAGRPPDFTGSAGRYSISAEKDPEGSGPGTALIRVAVKGEGNLWNVELPPLDLGDDFELIKMEPKVNAVTATTTATVTGSKIFDIYVGAKHTGKLTFPAVSFSYFDYKEAAYKTVMTDPIPVAFDQAYKSPAPAHRKNAGVVLLIDSSGSMLAFDFDPLSRLDAAKQIGLGLLAESRSPWVGVKNFSKEVEDRYAGEPDPLKVQEALKAVAYHKEKDGSALGDAIYGAITALNENVEKGGRKEIFILGDGVYNAGHLDPRTSIKWAKEAGIRIHTVIIGTKGEVPFPKEEKDGSTTNIMADVGVNATELKLAAEQTGGAFAYVDSPDKIQEAASQIVKML